jgi:hypothetical protein
VERVGVLHGELATPHDAEPRTDLVPELGLDLVEGERQLSIGADLVPHQVGHYLLVRRPQRVATLVAVGHAHHEGAIEVPASGLLPQFRRPEDRQHQLDRADPVELLADDRVDLEDHPLEQGQVAVDPPGHLPQHSGPHHEPVAHDLRVGGIFLERGDEGTRPAHGAAMYPAAAGRC